MQMRYRVFIDGQEGTTGLKIQDYLSSRDDLEIMKIPTDKRKDIATRRSFLNEAHIVFLCLPDEAARESVSLIDNKKTRVIDSSTAHRTHPRWVYGLPELGPGQRERIRSSLRVSNPGCHATGFILLACPLVKKGIIPVDYPIYCMSITGYSGGGRKLIERFEDAAGQYGKSPKPYSLKLNHKHLPEMQKLTGLLHPPLFTPIVAGYYNGMVVSLPIFTRYLLRQMSVKDICELLADYYSDEAFIRVMPCNAFEYLDENGFLDPEGCNNTNRVDIFVFGHHDQILLMARFDNLGKGASGAAVQNMNIMLGLDEGTGLSR